MRRLVLELTLAMGLAVACEVASPPVPARHGPARVARPAATRWSEDVEAQYADFVARFGAAVEARRCTRFADCLADPVANSTYDPLIDGDLGLDPDCADLPYLLRGYFAFKRRLPFGFVAATEGEGGDLRYAVGVRPMAWRTSGEFRTPRALFRALTRAVHTGMYRTPAEIETGDVYPVRVDRDAVRPGTIFYDPLGHVSIVARVRDDGEVFFVAGTPEGMLTWKRFTSSYIVGAAELGGGFKRWRPQRLEGGRLLRASNAELDDFDGGMQYDVARRTLDGTPVGYAEWVRARLRLTSGDADRVAAFREKVRALCRDVLERVESVDLAVRAGMAARPHPPALPVNIYAASGAWETHATAARDARLRAAFRELHDETLAIDTLFGLAAELSAAWAEETAAPSCRFVYVGSRGDRVPLSLDTVLDRLFDLSFDPYHCPELRWGAPPGSAELEACAPGPDQRSWYAAERRLRNRGDRDDAPKTALDSGPEEPPEVDVRAVLAAAARASAEAGL